MFKRIRVRSKLLLLIATPLLAVLVFAFSGITDRTDAASFQEREARIAEFANAGADFSLAIRQERLRTMQEDFLGTDLSASDTNPLATEQANTNLALDHWLTVADAVRGDIDDPDLIASLDLMAERLPVTLTPTRSTDQQVAALVSFLELASESIDDITASLTDQAADLDLFRALSDHNQLQAIQSAYADITSVGADALSNGELTVPAATLLQAVDRRIEASTEAFKETAAAADVAALDELEATGVLPSPGSAGSQSVTEVQLFLDDPSMGGFLEWVVRGEDRLVALNGLIDSLLDNATASAVAEVDAANDDAQSFLVLAGTIVLLALLFALVIGHSISRPLIRLTRNAEQLSSEELPALVESMRTAGNTEPPALTPIEVKGRDEVAQLARAISEIQQVTFDVAEEQGDLLRRGIAEIFVNLARRNQSLLDRQIDFIDQLESREEDPDQLENLFRLDHLATRMRRNAESLLVLAGVEPSRRRGQPVEIADVIRVAMGEIEDFGRVRLPAIDGATVAGSVAADLAHLMSELMENATQFSPPDVDVEVRGARLADGAYELTLTDRGIGMSAEQIGTVNRTLAEPAAIGLDLSRSLGFTVISRLAHRLGVTVRLIAGADGGVIAVVTIPAEMVGEIDEDALDAGPGSEEPILRELPPEGDIPGRPIEPVAAPPGADIAENPFVEPPAAPAEAQVVETPAASADELSTLHIRQPREAEPPRPAAESVEPAPLPTRKPAEPPLPTRESAEPAPLPTRESTEPPLPTRESAEPAPLPTRKPAGSAPLPTREPVEAVDGSATSAPAEHDEDDDGDLFAPFGTPAPAPLPPVDPDGDLFAPLAPAPPQPAAAAEVVDQPAAASVPDTQPAAEPHPTVPSPAHPEAEPTPVGGGLEDLPTRNPADVGAVSKDVTSAGLIRRNPKQVEVPEASRYSPGATPDAEEQTMTSPTANRSPEEVRQMLSRYRAGLRKGRTPEPGGDHPNGQS